MGFGPIVEKFNSTYFVHMHSNNCKAAREKNASRFLRIALCHLNNA